MTQLTRRASMLVALYLLTSAATAYAGRAWVLWEKGSWKGGDYTKWELECLPDTFDPRGPKGK